MDELRQPWRSRVADSQPPLVWAVACGGDGASGWLWRSSLLRYATAALGGDVAGGSSSTMPLFPLLDQRQLEYGGGDAAAPQHPLDSGSTVECLPFSLSNHYSVIGLGDGVPCFSAVKESSKRLRSAVPSRMRREIDIHVSCDEVLKVKPKSIIYTRVQGGNEENFDSSYGAAPTRDEVALSSRVTIHDEILVAGGTYKLIDENGKENIVEIKLLVCCSFIPHKVGRRHGRFQEKKVETVVRGIAVGREFVVYKALGGGSGVVLQCKVTSLWGITISAQIASIKPKFFLQ
nr:uncharacterized protein LOC109150426 [Ipomoea batatas]